MYQVYGRQGIRNRKTLTTQYLYIALCMQLRKSITEFYSISIQQNISVGSFSKGLNIWWNMFVIYRQKPAHNGILQSQSTSYGIMFAPVYFNFPDSSKQPNQHIKKMDP